jgi:predicted nucleic acid-binding protein
LSGWLLDTNVVSELHRERPDAAVAAWARQLDGSSMSISVLTLAEYDKGVSRLPLEDERRALYAAQRDAVQTLYARRILSVSDAIVRRWGVISGDVKRRTGIRPMPSTPSWPRPPSSTA